MTENFKLVPCNYYLMGGANPVRPAIPEGTATCGMPVEKDGEITHCDHEVRVEKCRIVEILGACPLKEVFDSYDNIASRPSLPQIRNV